MSALVLGKRSSCFFEELHQTAISAGAAAASPPASASKRARFGASPLRLSPPRCGAFSPEPSAPGVPLPSPSWGCGAAGVGGSSDNASPLGHLRSLFPDMDEQLLARALEASGNDLDSAIRSLNELCLGSAERSLRFVVNNPVEGINVGVQPSTEVIVDNTGGDAASGSPAVNNIPADGSEWVELFVREMMNATDVDDARARASSVLEVFEKSIMARASAEAAQPFLKENMMLKDQVTGLLRDNNILKRAVAIQHERQKEFDEKNQELQHLKQLLAQYQEQLRTLEVNNYALSMHLKQAQQSSSIPGRFHPDVF